MDMAGALLVVLGFSLLGMESGSEEGSDIFTSISDDGSKIRLTCTLNSSGPAVLGHRWMKGDELLWEDTETSLITEYEADSGERTGQYYCTFLSELTSTTATVTVSGPPNVVAVSSSELGIEKERAVLVCEARSFPPVTEWQWYKIVDAGYQLLNNQSHNKFVVSSDKKTELHIHDLNMKADAGQYACNGTNTEGEAGAVITLRLRSRLAALWPFLGVLTEVVVLVTIILTFEKCRKPEEIAGEEDAGSAPPKSSGHRVNDKDESNDN